jgi:D-arabinose 1-dehydrogenase-like Zn-dependent alcohol dehydrogenase
VGIGWFGGNCGYCEWCRRGSLIDCENMGIPGVTMDGDARFRMVLTTG